MSKIRINDLARELEVKSKAILDVLEEVGVTEKKTHSSSLEEHEAEKVRAQFRASGEAQAPGRAARPSRSEGEEIKTKIDLSHISKPGDVLKAIISKQQPAATAPARPPEVPAAEKLPPSAAAQPAAAPPPGARAAQPPKFVVPTQTIRPTFTVPPPAPPATSTTVAPVRPTSPPPVTPVQPPSATCRRRFVRLPRSPR